jgi:hypothetical protein
MRDEQTWRVLCGSSQSEPPPWRQADLVEAPDHQGEGAGSEPLFHRPQGVRPRPRGDDHQRLRRHSEGAQAWAIEAAALGSHVSRHGPEHLPACLSSPATL